MATNSSIYGLLNPKSTGKLSLQTLGGQALDDQQVDENGLPTSPFANLPITIGTGSSSTPGEVQQVVGANIPSNFQFTGEFDSRNRQYLQQETDAGFQRKNTLASIADQYLQAVRQAEQNQSKSRKSLFASLADRGALGSGASLESVADFDTSYNDYLNNLSRQRAAGIADTENSYASILNQLGRQREGLVSEQQKAEETRRLAEEQARAEAARQTELENQRRSQIQQMLEQQQQAIAAANAATQAAAARSTYSNGFSGGGYSGGGGGGGYQPPAPQQQAPQAPQDWVQAPNLAQGTTMASFTNWVHNNLDANASPQAVNQVLAVFNKNGGAKLSDLAWLIQQYPNNTSGGDKQYAAGGGRRF